MPHHLNSKFSHEISNNEEKVVLNR
jgi:hypothetical protein